MEKGKAARRWRTGLPLHPATHQRAWSSPGCGTPVCTQVKLLFPPHGFQVKPCSATKMHRDKGEGGPLAQGPRLLKESCRRGTQGRKETVAVTQRLLPPCAGVAVLPEVSSASRETRWLAACLPPVVSVTFLGLTQK